MRRFRKILIGIIGTGLVAYVGIKTLASLAIPEYDFVPDEKTAIRIGEAVGIPVYGEKAIESQRPLKAFLQGEVWTVTGSLPEGMMGGVLLVEISMKDGHILRMSHGQ